VSASNATENALMLLIFQNTNFANVGDATGLRGSTAAGSLYLSLHTADPGEAGDQSTSEISYTPYARVAVARSSGGWTVSGNAANLVATASFPAYSSGTGGTATFFGVGTAASGAGVLLFSGALSPTISVGAGVTPQLGTTTSVSCD
jgi:hypothetical protein